MGPPSIDRSAARNGAVSPWQGEIFVFPATVGQQGFWYLDQLEKGNPAYNIAVRFRLEGPLNHAALARAMNEIVRRHESLRTVVLDVDGHPVQVVAPSLSIEVPVVDLGDVPAAERHARSQILAVEEARRRFDLAVGPLIRASLVRLDEEDHVLLVTVHHVISDGWSIGVITQELGALYDAFCRGLKLPLADLSLQYGDFAVWQKQWLESTTLEGQLFYWKDKLACLPVLEIPTDRPRPAVQTSNGYIESLVLARALTHSLKEISNQQRVTFFVLALAALKVLLSRHTGQTDIFVGTLVAGRPRVELEPLVGLFVNPLVLRTELSGDPTFPELLARVRETVMEAFANQEVPFERVVEVVQPKRDPSRHPVFQINFIYQRDFVRPLQVSGLTLTALPSMSPGAIYDLNFFMVERADGWRASCEYNTDLYEAVSINRLLAQFQSLLEGIAADPSRRLADISMLTAADRESWMPATVRSVRRPTAGEPRLNAADSESFVAPRNEIEGRLVKLWEQILGFNGLSVTADFFDVGGHSLLVAKLLARTERTFRKKVPLAAFLQSPTIHGVARFLGEQHSDVQLDRFMAIQPDGFRPPLTIVDAGVFFIPLTRCLGSDQPVFSLLLPELIDLPQDFSVADIVDYLMASLREACPHGPYHLSGLVPRRRARIRDGMQRLSASGEDVALYLFDTNCPSYLRTFKGLKATPVRLYLLADKLIYHFGNFRRMSLKEGLEYARERVNTILEGWKKKYWQFWYRDLKRPAADDLNISSTFLYLAVDDYDPAPTAVPITLLRSTVLQTGRFRDPLLGWGQLASGGLVLHELPGNHINMFMEPIVQDLARKLAESMNQNTNGLPSNRSRGARVSTISATQS